ncbi:MAG: PDC sensor domain-containing protein [Nocardioidaceae bacterium]|nr:PDC sensor domain-containing protein [Nocardioidaceae bacterium]
MSVEIEELAGAVAEVVEPAFARLADVAGTVAAGPARRPWAEADLAPVRERLVALVAEDAMLVGLGFVAAPGIVEDRERYLLWWERKDDRLSRLRLNFDPSSIDVYDYLQMEWYQEARGGRDRVAFGPYVDYSGSGLYIVTATVPVRVDGEFVGVAGADLVASELERRLVTVLQRAGRDAVLVGPERRVVAANTPRWVVGTRLPSMPVPGDEFAAVAEVPSGTGWILAIGS